MKVKVESYGGFAGYMEGERTSGELSPQQLKDIGDLEQKGVAINPKVGSSPLYRVTVIDEKGERQLEVPEVEMPDSLTSIPAPKLP